MGLKGKSIEHKSGGKPINAYVTGGFSKLTTRPVLAVALSLIFFAFVAIALAPFASAADPGHPASSVSAGTFESGDFVFPQNLTINKFFAVNGTTLFVDAVNARVGIGTTSPGSKLSIWEADGSTATLSIRGGNSSVSAVGEVHSKIDLEQRDASVTGYIAGRIAAINEYSNGAYAGLGFYTAKQGRTPELQEAVRINYDGKVGIGTTTPTQKLDVAGTMNVSNITLKANCADGEVLKWASGVGTCGTDTGVGSESDPIWA
ncbi:MAG: hypothetical protein NTU57_05955, partial [Candidatus Aenigmarchaeota archaeon]|nr:hypothetical protein [Candidatus Aenigmarchaeota archaeon]